MTEKLNQSSGKRKFNLPHVFDRTVVVLLVVYAVILMSELLEQVSGGYFSYRYYDEEFRNVSSITFIAGLIVSFVQFRFLQVKTKCLTILSLGESRKSLFRKKFWVPLIIMVVITIGLYIALLFSDKDLKKFFSVLADEYFANMLIALLPLVVGYTAGAFSSILCGKTSETIVFGASICAFPFAVFNVVDAVFALSLKGYYTVAAEYVSFSNYIAADGNEVTTILSLFDPLYTLNPNIYGFANRNYSTNLWYETPAFYIIKNLVWIGILIFAVFFLENHFVKNFKAEFCNKSGKNKLVAIMCSLTPALLVVVACMSSFYQALLVDATPISSAFMLLVSLFFAMILTLIIIALLYRKTLRIGYSFLGMGFAAGISLIVYLISVTGCFGYSTYMPDTQKIKSVMVNDIAGVLNKYSDSCFYTPSESAAVDISFKTPEEIDLIKDIHKFVLNDKKHNTNESFTVVYELENGELIYRTYTCVSNEACEKVSALWETPTVRSFYKIILNQAEELNSTGLNTYWTSWEKAFSFNTNSKLIKGSGYYDDYGYGYEEYNSYRTIAAADSLVIYSKDGAPEYITDDKISSENMEMLKKAIYTDYMNMSSAQHYKPEKQLGVISLASCEALIECESDYWDEEYDGELTAERVLDINEDSLYRFSVTSDMVNTIKVLKDVGAYKYFDLETKIAESHLIDSQKLLSWYHKDIGLERLMVAGISDGVPTGFSYSWENYGMSRYLMWGCGYIPEESYDGEAWEYYQPIAESDIEKLTPEEAEKLREKAFMTYNAGNDCKFLVMKHTDGTTNVLVIPN